MRKKTVITTETREVWIIHQPSANSDQNPPDNLVIEIPEPDPLQEGELNSSTDEPPNPPK